MSTTVDPARPVEAGPGQTALGKPRARRGTARDALAVGVALAIPAVALSVLYLSVYVTRRLATPLGSDTPKYIWRANLVGSRGLESLLTVHVARVNGDRPGYPVVASILHSALGVSPYQLTFVLPALMAVVIGLSAGAVAVGAITEPRWAVPAYAVGVGGSMNVAIMAISHADEMLAVGLLLGAAALTLLAVEGKRASVGAVILMVGAILFHWTFAAVLGAVLSMLALTLLPGSLRARREGSPALLTPSARIGSILGASAVLGGCALLLAPRLPQAPPPSRGLFLRKIQNVLPAYRLPVSGPLAALGAAALWVGGGGPRRRGLLLALLWVGTAAVAAVALYAGAASPAHRLLGFALTIPLLAVAGLVGMVRLTGRFGPLGRGLAVILLCAGIALSAAATHHNWSEARPAARKRDFAQAASFGVYLRRFRPLPPAVVVINRSHSSVALAIRVIRATVPPDAIDRLSFYEGDPESLPPAGTLTPNGSIDPEAVVLTSSAFDRDFGDHAAAHPQWVIAPGIAVVRGPRPSGGIQGVPDALPPGRGRLGARFALILLVWLATGLGWSVAFTPAGWLERIALGPAFGLATLAIAGLLVDAAGAILRGPPGVLALVTAALAGWGAAAWKRPRGRRHSPPAAAGAGAPDVEPVPELAGPSPDGS